MWITMRTNSLQLVFLLLGLGSQSWSRTTQRDYDNNYYEVGRTSDYESDYHEEARPPSNTQKDYNGDYYEEASDTHKDYNNDYNEEARPPSNTQKDYNGDYYEEASDTHKDYNNDYNEVARPPSDTQYDYENDDENREDDYRNGKRVYDEDYENSGGSDYEARQTHAGSSNEVPSPNGISSHVVEDMLKSGTKAVHIKRTKGFNGIKSYQPAGLDIDIESLSKEKYPMAEIEAPIVWAQGVGPAIMNGCTRGGYMESDPCSVFAKEGRTCENMLDSALFIGVGFDGRGFYSSESRKLSIIQRACDKGAQFQRKALPDCMAAYGLWDYEVKTETFSDAKKYVKYLQDKSGSMETESMFQAESDAFMEGSSSGFDGSVLGTVIGAGIGAAAGGGAGAEMGAQLGAALGGSIGFGSSSKSGSSNQDTKQEASSSKLMSMSNSNGDSSSKNMIAVLEADMKLYELALGIIKPEDLSAEFYSNMMDLPSSYFQLGADQKFQSFILRWGTHYIKAATFGGELTIIKTSKKEANMNEEQFATQAQNEFSAMLGSLRSSMAQKKSSFSILGYSKKKQSQKQKSKNTRENRAGGKSSDQEGRSKNVENSNYIKTTLKVVGGDPKVAAAFSSMFSPQFADDFKEWLSTIEDFVRPIDFILGNISDLLSINVDHLFTMQISRAGCYGSHVKKDEKLNKMYFERNVTKFDAHNKAFIQTTRNYCEFGTRKEQLKASLASKKLALEIAEDIYLAEGPSTTANFDIEGGPTGCESDNIEFVGVNDKAARSWPAWKLMKTEIFRAIFQMPQDLPIIKHNSEFLVKFHQDRWYTKSPIPGAGFSLDWSCPDTEGETERRICIAQLPLLYSEEDGLLKLDIDLYRKYNVTVPLWLYQQPLGHVELLEANRHYNPSQRGMVGLIPCNMKWYNSHQIIIKEVGEPACLYFKAASPGAIHVVFAGIPEDHKTWLSLRLSSGSVSFYQAMKLKKFDVSALSRTLGSATLFEPLFICIVKLNKRKVQLQYGKSPKNTEIGVVHSSFKFSKVKDFGTLFYAFGSGDKRITIRDLRIVKGKPTFACRKGLIKNSNGTCTMICDPQCRGCYQANNHRSCLECKNVKIITGHTSFSCVEDCPIGFERKGENCVCPSGNGLSGYDLRSEYFGCKECPAGTRSDGHLCQDCPENTFSAAGGNECTPCWIGRKSGPKSASCDEEVLHLLSLEDRSLMKSSSGKASRAFAMTSPPWRPKGVDPLTVIYYEFPKLRRIGKFAFSSGGTEITVDFDFVGRVHCDNKKWDTLASFGTVKLKPSALNFWYVPLENRKEMHCYGLRFKPSSTRLAVSGLRMWEQTSNLTLAQAKAIEKGCWSSNGYDGLANTTESGIPCQAWNSNSPHKKDMSKIAKRSYLLDNYCREDILNTEDKAPWCYTTDPKKRWERCDIPKCSVEIRLRGGITTRSVKTGRVEVKHNGRWGTVCRHDWDILDAEVVCRQFDLSAIEAETNITDKSSVEELRYIHLSHVACKGTESNLAMCKHSGFGNNSCTHDMNVGVTCAVSVCCGHPDCSDYRGNKATTASGRICQSWNSDVPHKIHKNAKDKMLSAGLSVNYCRNPTAATDAWCYTMDKDKKWEYCDIPKCSQSPSDLKSCCGSPDCSDYRGNKATTVSGRMCQPWNSDVPHKPSISLIRKLFGDKVGSSTGNLRQLLVSGILPYAGLSANYCRNPNNHTTVWCYTMDKDVTWEPCDVPKCSGQNGF